MHVQSRSHTPQAPPGVAPEEPDEELEEEVLELEDVLEVLEVLEEDDDEPLDVDGFPLLDEDEVEVLEEDDDVLDADGFPLLDDDEELPPLDELSGPSPVAVTDATSLPQATTAKELPSDTLKKNGTHQR